MFVMNVSLSDARGSGAGDLTSSVVWGFYSRQFHSLGFSSISTQLPCSWRDRYISRIPRSGPRQLTPLSRAEWSDCLFTGELHAKTICREVFCRDKRRLNWLRPNRRYFPSPKALLTFHDRRLPFLIRPTIVDRMLQNGPQPLSKCQHKASALELFEQHLCSMSSLCQNGYASCVMRRFAPLVPLVHITPLTRLFVLALFQWRFLVQQLSLFPLSIRITNNSLGCDNTKICCLHYDRQTSIGTVCSSCCCAQPKTLQITF